ncbi:flagellar basal body protein, partial [Pelomicrobium sp.]
MGNSILNIGVTALTAAQTGLTTVGHNIANVNTPGYSRQQV